MSRNLLMICLAAVCSAAAADDGRAEYLQGMELYENHCTVCHDSVVHLREKRKAANLEAVEAYVRRWAGQLDLAWSDDEVLQVVNYLNSTYYNY